MSLFVNKQLWSLGGELPSGPPALLAGSSSCAIEVLWAPGSFIQMPLYILCTAPDSLLFILSDSAVAIGLDRVCMHASVLFELVLFNACRFL